MAVQLTKADTPAALITALSKLVTSGHPGQDTQLTRAVATATGEINSFPNATKQFLDFQIHRDNKISKISIVVQPVNLTNAGEIEQPPNP